MTQDELLRVERRLQMLIALIFFTPTVLSSLGSDTFQQDKGVLTWGIIVSIYIAIYILMEAFHGKLNKLKISIINYGVWINLIAFVPFLFYTGVYQDVISGLSLIAFVIAMMTIFWSPVILVLMLAFEFLLGRFFSSES